MKKILSILLVVTLAAGLTMGASAATITSGISKINTQQFQDALELNARAGRITVGDVAIGTMTDLEDLDVTPGTEIKIPLTANMFLKADGTPCGSDTDSVTSNALRSGKVTLRSTTSSNNVAAITLSTSKTAAYISVQFNKTPTTSKRRFSYSVYLYSGGTRKTETKITIKGIMEPEIKEVDSYDDYMDISDGSVVKPLTAVRGMELYLGNYVTIKKDLQRNVKYAGIAITDFFQDDERLLGTYGYIEYIYRLQTINLKGTGNIVYFDLDDVYYVYNSNGTYIGTSDKAMPYWTTYYLSSKKYESIKVR